MFKRSVTLPSRVEVRSDAVRINAARRERWDSGTQRCIERAARFTCEVVNASDALDESLVVLPALRHSSGRLIDRRHLKEVGIQLVEVVELTSHPHVCANDLESKPR